MDGNWFFKLDYETPVKVFALFSRNALPLLHKPAFECSVFVRAFFFQPNDL